ncbi:penicillin-binding protein 2 [Pseudooceanicola sp. CBS1P-1]|uniref:Beta-lactamase n=1 Tax=Pseudooceanicola albus TaxID=2692189 RepID=A0A6L7G1Q0_9RHOB|nr:MULTISPECIES: penicillin-binding protein 2 [Pseudooceanicola]MBT9384582.1 penicillin-binding protein 2 [Pseudooceanicola endophyticus]MXN18284.1 penicillin-binding protein 2 [Pseudooceanicola albus]
MKQTPKDSQTSSRRISRRALLLGTVQLGFMGVLAGRMHYLQVDQADQFRMLAEENRISVRLIPPTRGEIFDRNGIPVAKNEPAYRITMVREDAGDVDVVLDKLAELIPIDPTDIERAKTEMKRSAPFLPVTVAERVSWEDISKVAVNTPSLPGITPEVGLSRAYPLDQDFAHTVGYVGPVSDYDLSKIEDPDPVLMIPRFQIGKIGLENKMEDALRGSAGSRRVEVNAVGRVMRELDRQPGTPGANVQLTLDVMLQNYVQNRLAGESAAAVVIDTENGDILACASAPSFDPNLFVRGISSSDYNALMKNDHRPLADKSVQGLYPPGSTFKIVVALAGLEAGIIDASTNFYCPGYYEVANRRFHCWKYSGHGMLDVVGGLQHSCDVFFYELGSRVGIERISAMAERMGIGVKHDLPLSAVATGLAPTKEWKRANQNKDWLIGDTINASIGQGYVLASPLQLAVMAARLSTGRVVTPRVVRAVDGEDQPSGLGESLGIAESSLRAVRQGMFEVSNNRRGTAYGARIIAEDMRLAGKTGTSQVRNITAAERAAGVTKNQDLPWNRRDHALFVDFAPFEDPKVAVAVVVEHGSGGSSVAAPIARDITLQALCKGDPPLDAYPAKDRDWVAQQQERLRALRPQIDLDAKGRA